jgi:hypothetical protein
MRDWLTMTPKDFDTAYEPPADVDPDATPDDGHGTGDLWAELPAEKIARK